MATETAVNVTASGSSPIACVQQNQQSGAQEVQVQQIVLVDYNGTGTDAIGATVNANGSLNVAQSVGANNQSGLVSNPAVAYNSSATLYSPIPVTSGKVGTLQHAIFASSQPTLWVLQTLNNSSAATTKTGFMTGPNDSFDYRAATHGELPTVSSTGHANFQVIATNLSTNSNQTDAVYASFFWAEN
jgi:hypothetical protein